MVLEMILRRASMKLNALFNIVLLLFVIQNSYAQNQADTPNFGFLASIEKDATPLYATGASNVVFPEILKGNEEEMLPYIEKFSIKKRDYLSKMYTRGKNFLPKAAIILKKYNLPEELKVLLVLESQYDGNAISPAGAVGYWQIMDEVARTYGMKYISRLNKIEKHEQPNLDGKGIDKGVSTKSKLKDDRKNFYKATHAAARYLRDSKQYVDDNWLLVVASYNCGVGNVRKAIRKSGKNNPTFWDIKNYLPAVTRSYVMNFITLSVIFNNYEMFAKNKLNFASEKIIPAEDLQKDRTVASAGYPFL